MKWNPKTSILLIILIAGLLLSVIDIHESKASLSIYIRANGAIEPLNVNITTTDNTTYTFTDNNYGSIIIERDNIVMDGAEYTLQGVGGGMGIYLSGRNNVTIREANIEAFSDGIWLEAFSTNNKILRNKIVGNYIGIVLDYSSNYNEIFENKIEGNVEGVLLSTSSNYNIIAWNNMSNNDYGVYLTSSYNNSIHHNNFMSNTKQVHSYEATNYWDNNTEGNYWSDYIGSDTNSDGIGETPYNIDENNKDRYPLIDLIPEFSSFSILILLMLATSLFTLIYKKNVHL